MAEAWMKRSSEVQTFIEEWMRVLEDHFEYAEEDAGHGYLARIQAFATLIDKIVHVPLWNVTIFIEQGPFFHSYLLNEVIPAIEKFSRAPEEAVAIRARLAEKVLQPIFGEAESKYTHVQIHNPETLYEGHQTMDEVDL